MPPRPQRRRALSDDEELDSNDDEDISSCSEEVDSASDFEESKDENRDASLGVEPFVPSSSTPMLPIVDNTADDIKGKEEIAGRDSSEAYQKGVVEVKNNHEGAEFTQKVSSESDLNEDDNVFEKKQGKNKTKEKRVVKRDPSFVPKFGQFFLHDDRDNAASNGEVKTGSFSSKEKKVVGLRCVASNIHSLRLTSHLSLADNQRMGQQKRKKLRRKMMFGGMTSLSNYNWTSPAGKGGGRPLRSPAANDPSSGHVSLQFRSRSKQSSLSPHDTPSTWLLRNRVEDGFRCSAALRRLRSTPRPPSSNPSPLFSLQMPNTTTTTCSSSRNSRMESSSLVRSMRASEDRVDAARRAARDGAGPRKNRVPPRTIPRCLWTIMDRAWGVRRWAWIWGTARSGSRTPLQCCPCPCPCRCLCPSRQCSTRRLLPPPPPPRALLQAWPPRCHCLRRALPPPMDCCLPPTEPPPLTIRSRASQKGAITRRPTTAATRGRAMAEAEGEAEAEGAATWMRVRAPPSPSTVERPPSAPPPPPPWIPSPTCRIRPCPHPLPLRRKTRRECWVARSGCSPTSLSFALPIYSSHISPPLDPAPVTSLGLAFTAIESAREHLARRS